MKNLLTLNYTKLILILSLIIALSSCQDVDHILSDFPNKIEGTWDFDRVTFRKNWEIDGRIVTREYRDLVFNFYEDGYLTLEYVDSRGNVKVDEGSWEAEIEKDCYYDDDGSNCDRDRWFYITIYDAENGVFSNHTWEITYLGTQKIKAKEIVSDGVYKYKLLQRY